MQIGKGMTFFSGAENAFGGAITDRERHVRRPSPIDSVKSNLIQSLGQCLVVTFHLCIFLLPAVMP